MKTLVERHQDNDDLDDLRERVAAESRAVLRYAARRGISRRKTPLPALDAQGKLLRAQVCVALRINPGELVP